MKAKIKVSGEIIDVKKREERVGKIIYVYYYAQSGESFQDYELEFLPDTPEEVTIEGYVARDKGGGLYLHREKPFRGRLEWHTHFGYPRNLPQDSFPSVTWQSEPKRVKITITPME